MALNFSFIGGVEIRNVNIRKEGSEAAGILAVDIQILGIVNQEAVAKLLSVNATEVKSFWNKDENNTPKFHSLKELVIKSKFHEMCAKLDKLEFNNAVVKQITIALVEQKNASVRLTISISNVDEATVGHLGEMLMNQYECSISAAQGDLLEGGDKAA